MDGSRRLCQQHYLGMLSQVVRSSNKARSPRSRPRLLTSIVAGFGVGQPCGQGLSHCCLVNVSQVDIPPQGEL